MAETLFWILACLVGYTYVGYPLAIAALARMYSKPTPKKESATGTDKGLPKVAVLLCVHNEQSRLAKRLENLFSCTYPKELLRVVVVCDGCTDKSEQIASSFPNVKVLLQEKKLGKAAALNLGMSCITEPVTVFCDARQSFSPDTISKLVEHLEDELVGAVGGELSFTDSNGGDSDSIGVYWRYEKWIRGNESSFDSSVGLSGACYAIRTNLFRNLPVGTLCDDLLTPLEVSRTGARTLHSRSVVFFDSVTQTHAQETKRKIRTLAGNFQLIWENPWVLNPLSNRLAWQFISHKFLRLLMPLCLVGLLLTSFVSSEPYLLFFFWVQVLFWIAALIGRTNVTARSLRLVNIASLFLDLNLAAVRGFIVFAKGQTDTIWTGNRS